MPGSAGLGVSGSPWAGHVFLGEQRAWRSRRARTRVGEDLRAARGARVLHAAEVQPQLTGVISGNVAAKACVEQSHEGRGSAPRLAQGRALTTQTSRCIGTRSRRTPRPYARPSLSSSASMRTDFSQEVQRTAARERGARRQRPRHPARTFSTSLPSRSSTAGGRGRRRVRRPVCRKGRDTKWQLSHNGQQHSATGRSRAAHAVDAPPSARASRFLNRRQEQRRRCGSSSGRGSGPAHSSRSPPSASPKAPSTSRRARWRRRPQR